MRNVPVNEAVLRQVVTSLENEGGFASLSDLYKAVAAAYNKHPGVSTEITGSIVLNRIKQFGINIRTVAASKKARGKKMVEVNKDVFKQVVASLEEKQTFSNLSKLYVAVADEYNKQPNITPITAAIVPSRIARFEIQIKTQPGKPGGSGRGGKTKVAVDKSKLEAIVKEVEANGPVQGGISALAALVADRYNADDSGPDISAAVVYSRIREFEIAVQTQSKKGREKQQKLEFLRENAVDACRFLIESEVPFSLGGYANNMVEIGVPASLSQEMMERLEEIQAQVLQNA